MSNASLFVKRLGLAQTVGTVHVICPFHPDTDPSMSIDLDKGIFFCHGGCDVPKGGDVVLFVQKWAWAKTGKKITLKEARDQVKRGYIRRTSEDLHREMREIDVRLFFEAAAGDIADVLRELDKPILLFKYPTPSIMDFLAAQVYRRTQFENWFTIARDAGYSPHLPLRLEALELYETMKAAGVWNADTRLRVRNHQRYVAQKRQWEKDLAARQLEEPACQIAAPSQTNPQPIRTALTDLKSPLAVVPPQPRRSTKPSGRFTPRSEPRVGTAKSPLPQRPHPDRVGRAAGTKPPMPS